MKHVILIGLFLLALANIYLTHTAPFERSVWKDTPSRIQFVAEIPATNVESNEENTILVGDFLVEVNGAPVSAFGDEESAVFALGEEEIVSLKTFRPADEQITTWQVERAEIPEEFINILPPTVYVQKVLSAERDNSSPLKRGDILLRVNEQTFVNQLTRDLAGIIHFSIETLLSRPSLKSEQADRSVLNQKVDEAITVDLLRQTQTVTVAVPLSEYNLARAIRYLGSTFSEEGIAGIRALDFRSLIPLQIAIGLIFMLRGIARFWSSSGSKGSTIVLGLGYLLLTYGLRKGAIVGSFEGIEGFNAFGLWGLFMLFWLAPYSAGNIEIQKPNILRSIAFAMLVLLPWWFVYQWFAIAPPDDSVDYFSVEGICKNLFNSGVIPISILWVFLFGLDYLLQIYQKNGHALNPQMSINGKIIEAVNSGDRKSLDTIFTIHNSFGILGYYGERIKQLILRYQRDEDLSALLAMRDDILTQDEEDFSLFFVAVSWSEKALPLLGFLGTVLGIRVAVNGIARSINVIANGGTLKSISGDLNAGFAGIGLAFDTTFYALAGLLVIGLLHTIIKKGLAAQLNYARSIFDKVIYMLATRSVVGELATVAVEIKSVSSGIHTVVQGTESSTKEMKSIAQSTRRTYTQMQAAVAQLRESSQFRKAVQNLAEQIVIEHPGDSFEKIRDIILKPLVQFQRVGEDQAIGIRKAITEELGTDEWSIACIGTTATSQYNGFLALRYEDSNDLIFPFSIRGEVETSYLETDYHFSALYPAQNGETMVGITESYEIIYLNWQQRITLPISSIEFDVDSKVFLVSIGQADAALIIQNVNGQHILQCLWMYSGQPTSSQETMSESFTWTKWDVHTPSGTLFALGQSNRDGYWQIQCISIHAYQEQNMEADEVEDGDEDGDEQDNLLDPSIELRRSMDVSFETQSIRFPEYLDPQEIVALGDKEILILDTKGDLYFWSLEELAPQLLDHRRWNVRASDCTIRAGANGWVAVISGDQLRMWRVRLGRYLSPYEPDESYHIVDEIKESLVVTPDGRYLLAIANKQIIATWEFPRYIADAV